MLNTHSYFSLRYGTIEPKDLLALAAENDHACCALTDINCTAGVIDFFREAKKYPVQPVVGIDFRNGAQQQYVGLAKSNAGYYQLCRHLSEHIQEKINFEARAPQLEEAFIIYPIACVWATTDLSLTENEFIGIHARDIPRLRFSKWKDRMDKLVVLNTVTFRNKRDFNAHRLLRAIDNNTLLSKLSKSEEGHPDDVMMPRAELEKAFEEFRFILSNTERILEQCNVHFSFDGKEHLNQKTYTGSEEGDYALMERLCRSGMQYRYPHAGTEEERLNKELKVIRDQGFVAYFLIICKILCYARSRNYYYVGRGSGANSIVAYLLRITDVDPIELDLYFERFINVFRKNPPDFDIDFSWKDRDDITDFIFSCRRFKNVSLLGAINTFQYSAVVRELGKVFGLPKSEIDMLSDGKYRRDQLDSMQTLVLQYGDYLKGFPNYISIHAAGILITEESVHHYGGTFMPPKGYPTTQFDMHHAEDIGINKLDILSQRGLGKIKDSLEIIRESTGEEVDIHDTHRFKHDAACNELLRTAQAIGCFYVESPAMRMLLTKLQTHDYLGLVAASSVIRPGVASSGMMAEYIKRERDESRRPPLSEPLMQLMPETHGIMVYQEDVIKVAHEFAGLDLGEADVLRRGMSGKYRGRDEFQRAKEKFMSGGIAKGHEVKLVADVWRQVESFAGYAFAKGHSASYAVESYQCLFLKAYYPLAYMTATINNYGGFYRTEIYVHEARMHGGIIKAPCVNTSMDGAYLRGNEITLGMEIVKELEVATRASILAARNNGPFLSLNDFLDRVKISLEQAVLLARIGALRFTGSGKKELMWQLHFRLARTKTTKPENLLFRSETPDGKLPVLEHSWLEDAYDELELIGFPLCNPFDMLEEHIDDEVPAADLSQYAETKKVAGEPETVIRTIGYKVTLKPTTTVKGEGMIFGTFLDRKGHFIDTVHFPPVAAKYPISGWGLFLIEGIVRKDYDAISLEVTSIRKLKLIDDPRLTDTPSHPALMRKQSGEDKWVNRHMRAIE